MRKGPDAHVGASSFDTAAGTEIEPWIERFKRQVCLSSLPLDLEALEALAD
jgi:hypothetical protein